MFYCKFANMYDNDIFAKYNQTPIAEDYFKVDGNIFCVADGVTRDNIYGQAVPYPNNEEEVRKWIKEYPNPSGAYEAAKICADKFVEYVSKHDESKINKEMIMQVAKQVNQDIWIINKDRKIDYQKEDYYCCEAVGGIIIQDKMYCFSIGDCHITLLDKDQNIVFTTINNHKQFEDYLDNIYIKNNAFDWNNPEDRIMVRKHYRNKPDKKYKGQDVSFGALSGEKEAEHYIDVYEVPLEKVEYICAYSDGCEPIFEEKERIKEMLENPESIESQGKERTLVIYERK